VSVSTSASLSTVEGRLPMQRERATGIAQKAPNRIRPGFAVKRTLSLSNALRPTSMTAMRFKFLSQVAQNCCDSAVGICRLCVLFRQDGDEYATHLKAANVELPRGRTASCVISIVRRRNANLAARRATRCRSISDKRKRLAAIESAYAAMSPSSQFHFLDAIGTPTE
jgi:hypothetical protein